MHLSPSTNHTDVSYGTVPGQLKGVFLQQHQETKQYAAMTTVPKPLI